MGHLGGETNVFLIGKSMVFCDGKIPNGFFEYEQFHNCVIVFQYPPNPSLTFFLMDIIQHSLNVMVGNMFLIL